MAGNGKRPARRSSQSGWSPEVVDRVLAGSCALIWLVWLGMSVAAVVALIDLGRGFREPAHDSHSGLLYIVIGVSALVILAAIPLLARARSGAAPPVTATAARGSVSRLPAGRVAAAPAWPTITSVGDRVLLRGTAELTGAIGMALTGVALATYLMAVGRETGAWIGYGFAGLVTALMPVILWRYLRQLPR